MQSRWSRSLALMGGWLVASLVLLVRALPTWDTVVDDAYITARYAEQLAAGNGLVYNAGQPPVEGYTNLAWTLMLGGLRLLGAPAHEAMIGLGFGWAVLGLLGMVLLSDVLLDRPKAAWLPAVPALALAATPHYAVVATNGLETPQFLAWATLSIWGVWVSKGHWRWLAGLALGGLCAVRPEGVAVAGGVVLLDLIERRRDWKSPSTWAPLFGVVAVFVPLELWRWSVYGAWVPNTGPAKANMTWSAALKLNSKYVGGDADFWIGALILGVVGAVASRWTWKKVLLLCLVAGLTTIASRVYLWMPGGRLLVLPYALLFAVAVMPLSGARDGAWRTWLLERRRRTEHGARTWIAVLRGARGIWGALALGFLGWVVVGHPTTYQRMRDAHHSVIKPNPARLAGEHLARHVPAGAWMATRDAGLLAWSVGTDIHVAETHPRALTQPHPEYADVDWKALIADPPEIVVFTVNSSDRKLFYYRGEQAKWRSWAPTQYHYLGRVEQHYRRHYDIYTRADLDVPALPEGVVTNYLGALPRAENR